MTDKLINDLGKIKQEYDINGSVELAVNAVEELFENTGKSRYDVAISVFNYKEIFQIEFCKKENKNQFKDQEKEYIEVCKKNSGKAYLNVLGRLFFNLLSKNKITSNTVFELAKEQTSKEYFKKLEKAMFEQQKEIMRSMLTPMENINSKEYFKTMREFYQNKYKGIVYEKELLDIYEELVEKN